MIDNLDPHVKKQTYIYEVNEKYLTGFENWLKNKGLSQKTIHKHISSVEFYINDYVCYYDLIDASQGCHKIYGFLGDWFIRKAAWSSCAHIKSYAASIKKFYAFMLEAKVVEQEDYDNLCDIIKEYMPEWLDEMKRYEDMLFEGYF
jgi:site-specific recombinase XerD